MIIVAHKWSYQAQLLLSLPAKKYLPRQVIQFLVFKVNTFSHEIGSKSKIAIYIGTFILFSMQCHKVLRYVIKICILYLIMIIVATKWSYHQVKLVLSLPAKNIYLFR